MMDWRVTVGMCVFYICVDVYIYVAVYSCMFLYMYLHMYMPICVHIYLSLYMSPPKAEGLDH